MTKTNRGDFPPLAIALLTAILAGCSGSSDPAGARLQQLNGYLRPELATAPVVARMEPDAKLSFVIDLPIQDVQGLRDSLRAVSDPASPSFHQFITPARFGERFGASQHDYQAAADWARANHLSVTTHANRLTLEVTGAVADVESALNVRFNYALRPDGTRFRTPDREPSIGLSAPIDQLENLDDYIPHTVHSGTTSSGTGQVNGGSPSVTAIDIRNAYLQDSVLNGAGQYVGIINNGNGCYNQSDISAYVTANNLQKLASIPLVEDALSASACPGGQLPSTELTMDIELVTAMAPGAQIVVAHESDGNNAFQYFADYKIYQEIPGNPGGAYVAQITSSYSWDIGSASANAMNQLAMQGQTFFTYAGDSGAYASNSNTQNYFLSSDSLKAILAVTSDPQMTLAGGTFLFMNGSSYGSEQAWDSGGGGLLSSASGLANVATPWYQLGLIGSGIAPDTQLSKKYRNSPDLSAVSSNIEEIITRAGEPAKVDFFYGTSASGPIWAGFTALVNQLHSVTVNQPTTYGLGFANPGFYAWAERFTDVTAGTNPSNGCSYTGQCVYGGSSSMESSCECYLAEAGYDLTTGLGTPNPTLLNQLDEVPACGAANFNRTCCTTPGLPYCARTASCEPVSVCALGLP